MEDVVKENDHLRKQVERLTQIFDSVSTGLNKRVDYWRGRYLTPAKFSCGEGRQQDC